MTDLESLGDRAFLARFRDEASAQSWARTLRAAGWPGVQDVVNAYASVAVVADPDRVELDLLERRLRDLSPQTGPAGHGCQLAIPVLYDGPDLPEIAERLGLSVDELIAAHSGAEYAVQAIGFLPGFPYAGPLPAAISGLPRRNRPRVRVPAGSVAIVERHTGIYPGESPGGWHLLGRTPLRIVDVEQGVFPIRTGDRLMFRPIDANDFAHQDGELLCPAPPVAST